MWTESRFSGARTVLLRDRDEPSRFYSFGPWESPDAVAEWRAAPEFQEAVVRLRELGEGFEPHTLDPVLEIGRWR